jgi:hypothetical protein
MKRIAALFAALLFAFAVAACNDDDGDATEAPTDAPAAEEVADEATEEESE